MVRTRRFRAVYPDSEIQTCIVHLIRNSLSFCNWKERKPVAAELKKIYNAETAELAAKAHIYYSLCESLRVSRKRVLQRQVLHLGELNTTQLERWQRTIEVVQEDGRRHQMRLFSDRHGEVAATAEKDRLYRALDRVDRGIVSEDNLQRLRERGASYLVGTPRAQLKVHERRLLEGDWQSITAEVQVQLIAQDNNETYVLARSRTRAQKESAMRSRVVRGLMRDLIRLRRLLRHGRLKDPAKVLLHLGRLKERYQQAWRYVKNELQELRLSWQWDRHALRLAASRDGAYLLRTNLEGSDPARLWTQYIQLTEVEAVFRALKSDLAIRPIWHFTPKRIEAHLMVAFLGYCLWVCLKHKLKASAPSLTPWQLLDQFGRIQLVEVWFKLRASGCICLERVTQPEAAQAALIHQLNWPLPQQPPPKIYSTDLENVWTN